MINEWRYHFLGGPLSGRTYLNREREIHDEHGIVDFPPTPEAWAKYRQEMLAEFYMVPASLAPNQDIGFMCRLAKSAIDKLNDLKASK